MFSLYETVGQVDDFSARREALLQVIAQCIPLVMAKVVKSH